MATLIPVEHDPFSGAVASGGLTPVDYDPFSAQPTTIGGQAGGRAGAFMQKVGDNLNDTVGGALGDIAKNTAENVKNAATQTGEAISEPLNNPNAHGAMAIPDAIVRTLGKAGNVIGGVFGAAAAPLSGALTASVENSGLVPAAASAIKENLVPTDPRFVEPSPEAAHQAAQGIGSDLTNAVMLMLAKKQGDQMQAAKTSPQPQPAPVAEPPRAGLMESTSSDPNAPPAPPPPTDYAPEEMKAQAVKYYDSSKVKGGQLTQQKWDSTVDDAISKAGAQTEKGKGMAGDNFVTSAQEALATTKGSPTSLQEMDEIDDDLRDRIGQAFRQGADKQAVAIMKMRDTLRSASTSAAEGDMISAGGFADWRTGDKLWTAYRTAKDIQDGIENAERADVPSTAIKNYFKSFVKNDDSMALLNNDEKAAAKHAAEYGIVTRSLKNIGSRLGAHITGTIIGGAVGSLGGPVGTALGALAGDAAMQAAKAPFGAWANARQAGRGNAVIDAISHRPEVQAAMSEPLANPPPLVAPPPGSPQASNWSPQLPQNMQGYGPSAPTAPPAPVTSTAPPSVTAQVRQMLLAKNPSPLKTPFAPSDALTPDILSARLQPSPNPTLEAARRQAQLPTDKQLMAEKLKGSPSEMLEQYGIEKLSDAGKLPPIIERPKFPDALEHTEPSYAEKLALAPANEMLPKPITTLPETPAPQSSNPLPYKDWTAEARKIVNTARAQGAPMKNEDMGRILSAALMNKGATQGQANAAIAAIMGGAALAAQQALDKKKQASEPPYIPTSVSPPATGGIGEQNMQELQKVKTALPPQAAAQPSPVDKFAKAESSGNPNAKNPNSTASGLYQFVDSTWAALVKKYGKDTGITLADKNNPQAQAVMARLNARDNIKTMEPLIGRMPTMPEVYAAHVFGAHGAARLINAQGTGKQAIMLFPKAETSANHSLFFNGNTPRTVEALYQLLKSKVS